MEKIILFLILIMTTLNVHAKWILVGMHEDANFYIKTDSIKRKGHMITYWEMLDFKSIQKSESEKQYSSFKMKNETNCNTEESKTIFMAVYSGSMGSGQVIDTFKTVDTGFQDIIPDSVAHKVFQFVCSKK